MLGRTSATKRKRTKRRRRRKRMPRAKTAMVIMTSRNKILVPITEKRVPNENNSHRPHRHNHKTKTKPRTHRPKQDGALATRNPPTVKRAVAAAVDRDPPPKPPTRLRLRPHLRGETPPASEAPATPRASKAVAAVEVPVLATLRLIINDPKAWETTSTTERYPPFSNSIWAFPVWVIPISTIRGSISRTGTVPRLRRNPSRSRRVRVTNRVEASNRVNRRERINRASRPGRIGVRSRPRRRERRRHLRLRRREGGVAAARGPLDPRLGRINLRGSHGMRKNGMVPAVLPPSPLEDRSERRPVDPSVKMGGFAWPTCRLRTIRADRGNIQEKSMVEAFLTVGERCSTAMGCSTKGIGWKGAESSKTIIRMGMRMISSHLCPWPLNLSTWRLRR